MTQEARELRDKMLKEAASKQQPIPQDINKFIQDKSNEKYGTGERLMQMKMWHEKIGFIAGAQLLLPELQQLREEVNEYSRNLKNCTERNGKLTNDIYQQAKEIEQQKSHIDELKNALNHELKVHKEFIQQAAEIESLKQENERLKEWATGNGHIAVDIAAKVDYWKQRCEAAEAIIEGNEVCGNVIEWETWQTLKQQTHG